MLGLTVAPAQAQSPPFTQPKIVVPEGFSVELVAAPPLVEHPMMAGFDDQGRLYIAESAGKNLETPVLEKELPNFVRRLEDTDGDGRFDKSTIFADKMTYPMGALWHEGSLYVASPPHIWKLTDTDDDGVADKREPIVGRFGYIGNAADIHGCFLGPGGRIYWCDGRHGHRFTTPDGQVASEGQAARIFSARPDGGDIRVHCGGGMDNPVEIDFAPEGDMLGTVNLLYQKRGDCLVHWMHGGVYPRFDQEKMIAEFKRTGDLLTPVLDMGHVAVSGMVRYQGQAFGADYVGNIFVCEFNTHKVKRVVLDRSGSTFVARAEEFFAADSIDFHPTDVLEDADGSLLVIDTGGWFRFGCPTSQIEKPSILGAIYRVRKAGAPPAADPRGRSIAWNGLSSDKLVSLLADGRPAVRDSVTAALARRGEPALAALEAGLSDADPGVRRGVVWTLARIEGNAASGLALRALADADPSVRQAAAHAAGLARDRRAVAELKRMVTMDEPQVRRESATALGKIGDPAAAGALTLALAGECDRLLEHALIYALIEIDDPAATRAGLAALGTANAQAKRGVLIALDQMNGGDLTRSEVAGFLDSSDQPLFSTALAIVAKHPEWVDEILGLVDAWLSADQLDPALVPTARGTLVAFVSDPRIQEKLAAAVERPDLPAPSKLLLLEAIGRSNLAPIPDRWRGALAASLTDPDESVARACLAAIGNLGGAGFEEALVALGRDSARSTSLRACALATAARRNVALDDEGFALLAARLAEDVPAADRMQAADALGRLALASGQRNQLAELLARAGPLELPLLLEAFQSGGDDALGARVFAALARAPGLASLTPGRLDSLVRSFPEQTRDAAAELAARLGAASADQANRLEEIIGALTNAGGDLERGKRVFEGKKAACATCHRIASAGGTIGPDLSTIGRIRQRRDLVEAIVFPSASLARGYQTYTVLDDAGASHTGVLERETGDAVFLRNAQRDEVRIPRAHIEAIQPSSVSVMPQGLDKVLTPAELADLVAYLESLR